MDDSAHNTNQDANRQYTPSENTGPEHAGSDVGQTRPTTASSVASVDWSASEYIEHEKDIRWYGALIGGGVLLTALIFVITRDYLASAVVLLAIISIAVFAGRKPDTKQYSVDESGVKIGEKTYTYSQFRSFSLVEEGAINSIWLKPLKRFAPAVIMYFSPEDEQKIVDVLSNFLPHEDRELDAIDRFSKRVRF